jgi:hypothetical protein
MHAQYGGARDLHPSSMARSSRCLFTSQCATGLAPANATHVMFVSVPSEFASCVTEHLRVGASGLGDFHNENSLIAPQCAKWRIYSGPGTALGSP